MPTTWWGKELAPPTSTTAGAGAEPFSKPHPEWALKLLTTTVITQVTTDSQAEGESSQAFQPAASGVSLANQHSHGSHSGHCRRPALINSPFPVVTAQPHRMVPRTHTRDTLECLVLVIRRDYISGHHRMPTTWGYCFQDQETQLIWWKKKKHRKAGQNEEAVK